MDIAELLKKCPKGMKLYSPIFGEVKLEDVRNEQNFPIYCITEKGGIDAFTSDGRIYSEYPHAECVLFPSKDQRDWSKFIVPDQENKYQFKKYDRVLVRDKDTDKWRINLFLRREFGTYLCLLWEWWQCIPYEGNEHLLGTTNKPEQ